MHFKLCSFIQSFILFLFLLYFEVKCKDLENKSTTSSSDNSFDNSFNFDDFAENNKVMEMNLNQNCSTHEDCTAKHSICDSSYKTCECDMTSMQIQFKCKAFYCQTRDECSSRFPESTCVLGRCQCISGRKLKGKCIRGMGMDTGMGPLPDWAIISIALSLALSVVAGGSLRKANVRQYLMRIIRMLLMRGDSQEESTSSEEMERNVNKKDKDIELSDE